MEDRPIKEHQETQVTFLFGHHRACLSRLPPCWFYAKLPVITHKCSLPAPNDALSTIAFHT